MQAGEAEIDLEAQEVRFGDTRRALRDRPRDQAPPVQRPRRHRADARPGGRDRRLRARARARRAGHHGAVMSGAARTWDADTYHRVSSPHVEMGAGRARPPRPARRRDRARRRLRLGPRHPPARRAPAARAGHRRRRLAADGRPRARGARSATPTCARPTSTALRLADGERVDAAFSNAVFHWVPDHDALFAALAAAMRPGGAPQRAVRRRRQRRRGARAGARGRRRRGPGGPLRRLGRARGTSRRPRRPSAGWRRPASSRRALLAADVARRTRRATRVPADRLPRAASRSAWSADEHERFLDAVMARLGERPVLDYVRLNIVARRG